MEPKYIGGRPEPAYLPHWRFLPTSSGTYTMDGTSQSVTIPTGAQIVEIRARDGAVYFHLGAIAGTTSPFYVPEDQAEIIGPLVDFTQLALYGDAAVIAHVAFFREDL